MVVSSAVVTLEVDAVCALRIRKSGMAQLMRFGIRRASPPTSRKTHSAFWASPVLFPSDLCVECAGEDEARETLVAIQYAVFVEAPAS
jgi:hypothetical protein